MALNFFRRRLFSTVVPFADVSASTILSNTLDKQSGSQMNSFRLSSMKPVPPQRESYHLFFKLVQVRVVKLQTKFGKRSRFQALVFAGDKHGGIGMAMEKCNSVSGAFRKASRTAVKNMEYFKLFDNRTLFHDIYVLYHCSHVYFRVPRPDYGLRCHRTIQEMCKLMGIKDLGAKVRGSTTSFNVAKAFLLALRRQKSPEQVALDAGMKVADIRKIYHEGIMAKKASAFNATV